MRFLGDIAGGVIVFAVVVAGLTWLLRLPGRAARGTKRAVYGHAARNYQAMGQEAPADLKRKFAKVDAAELRSRNNARTNWGLRPLGADGRPITRERREKGKKAAAAAGTRFAAMSDEERAAFRAEHVPGSAEYKARHGPAELSQPYPGCRAASRTGEPENIFLR